MAQIRNLLSGSQPITKLIPDILVRINVRMYNVLSNENETCFIIHHSDKEHPYEMTKPMPKAFAEQSYLKIDAKNMFVKSPNLEQLQAVTYTPYRYWLQFPGKAKRKKYIEFFNDNVDRKGLSS